MLIQHITLSNGNTATHRLDTIPPGAVAACRALLPSGGPVPAFPAFRVEIHAPVFSLWRGKEPLVLCGVGTGEDETWGLLCEVQAKVVPVLAKPPSGRWLAVAILPGLVNLARNDVGWLADFERCLAAALLLP